MKNINFYYGSAIGSYEKVLDSLSTTEVHSYKTSSIPLTEFWMPKNSSLSLKIIASIGINKDEYDNAQKIFEYPVFPIKENISIGKPSMTDLMICSKAKLIAVEGKFTEDLYDTIKKWLEGSSKTSKKAEVLKGWYSYIQKYCISSKWGDKERINEKVVYQFLHRTASACSDCSKKPVVLYQLFYDAFDESSKKHQFEVATELQKYANDYLFFDKNKISFYVVFTPVLNLNEIETKHFKEKSSLFLQMKGNDIYHFGESIIFNCLEETLNTDKILSYSKTYYSDEEFLERYDELWNETWHRNQTLDYYKSIMTEYKKTVNGAFCKDSKNERYNKDYNQGFEKEKLELMIAEKWHFLTNKGYTKYAVSSMGRVAFSIGKKYYIIFQDDKNDDGYLRLDPEGEYNLDHQIEVYKLIAMGFCGKELGDNYDVHHRINDGYNCRPENLVLLTRSQHNAVHKADKLSRDKLIKFLKE